MPRFFKEPHLFPRQFFFGALLAIFGHYSTCRASTVYDNGAPYRPDPPNRPTGYEMTGYIEADDFTLCAPGRIDSITFSDLEFGSGFVGSIVWQIYSNAPDNTPGTILYSGTANNVSHVATGLIALPATEYANAFSIPPVSLPAGTYWLAMHNGPLSNGITGYVYWEKAEGAGFRPSMVDVGPLFSGIWYTNSAPSAPTAELLFQLIGVPCPKITGVVRTGGRPAITFTTDANEFYRVEYSDTLPATSWTPVTGAEHIAGTGGTVQVTDSSQNLGILRRRYYRAVLL